MILVQPAKWEWIREAALKLMTHSSAYYGSRDWATSWYEAECLWNQFAEKSKPVEYVDSQERTVDGKPL